MSCYHPMIGMPTGELTEKGKKKLQLRSIENTADIQLMLEKNEGSVLIPCGHCIGCRLDYSRYWADRMMLELEDMKKAVFLTLTYDEQNIIWSSFDDDGTPLYGTLYKKDFQDFLKRIRKYYSDHGYDTKLRFYLAGEYGSKTLRPHGHCILFGVGLDDINDLVPDGQNELGQKYYRSSLYEKIWSHGRVCVADVSWETCAYVARYCTKKLTGKMKEKYEERGCIPEFSLMSRKPGIGAKYLESHPHCLDYENINISTPTGGLKISIPKYYLDKLELTDPIKFAKIKEKRMKFASDKMLLELSGTDLNMEEYLSVKESYKNSKMVALKRD